LSCASLGEATKLKRHVVASASASPSSVTSTIDTLLASLIQKNSSSEAYNSSFLSRHSDSPRHILGAARGLLEVKRSSDPLPAETADEVQRILSRLADDGVPPSIPAMLEALDLLRKARATSAIVDEYRARCRKRLPLAWVFAPDAEKAERAAEREKEALPNGKADL